MKIRTLVMALAAFSFMLTACENKANKQETPETPAETVVEEQTEEPTFTADDVNQIGVIRSVWEVNPIPGAAVNGKTDIERFASVFCNEYSNYEPNLVLLNYLKDPKGFNDENYRVDNQKSNGYIKCMGMFQVSHDVTCCYWNRNNGHKLVAFWMEKGHESDPTLGDNLLVFYDYDPATDKMDPEPKLSEAIATAMAQYDDYTVVLPDKGKDIELVGHMIDYENDSAENTYYIYRWNGNDFKLEKAK
jgi:hypothetical protein